MVLAERLPKVHAQRPTVVNYRGIPILTPTDRMLLESEAACWFHLCQGKHLGVIDSNQTPTRPFIQYIHGHTPPLPPPQRTPTDNRITGFKHEETQFLIGYYVGGLFARHQYTLGSEFIKMICIPS